MRPHPPSSPPKQMPGCAHREEALSLAPPAASSLSLCCRPRPECSLLQSREAASPPHLGSRAPRFDVVGVWWPARLSTPRHPLLRAPAAGTEQWEGRGMAGRAACWDHCTGCRAAVSWGALLGGADGSSSPAYNQRCLEPSPWQRTTRHMAVRPSSPADHATMDSLHALL